MALRCLVFTLDGQTAALIGQVLAGLGVEVEACSEGPAAVEKVIQQSFHIVIIDWDMQPEAGLLLSTARDRKATERPLTLAIVSDDVSVPKALQAGANSILRKPVLLNQAQETLKTARDLLRARESAAQAAAASASASARPACLEQGGESRLRAGEFLPSSAPVPSAEFVIESEAQRSIHPPTTETLSPLKELEPTAAAVQAEPALPPPPEANEPRGRGLAWYLSRLAGTRVAATESAAAAAPAPEKPELIGYDQTPSHADTSAPSPVEQVAPAPEPTPEQHAIQEQKTEAQLFAYITDGHEEPEEKKRTQFRLPKKAIVGALLLAACAVAAAPQAPWHAKVRVLWARGRHVVHAWLNPQPVTTPPAPASHEDFARAGDEYKLPVAESIPDATTDPSQIRVVPVVDPTAKKPNNADSNPDQTSAQGAAANPADSPQAPAIQVQENLSGQPATTSPAGAPAAGGTAASSGSAADAAAAAAAHVRSDMLAAASSPPPPLTPSPLAPRVPPVNPLPHSVATPTPTNAAIPPSLKSQMASMTPDASGNKPAEAALPSIEPVDVPEATERGLLTTQPAIAYPANAKGLQGTVVLQVLIGRDGTVQDAKFLQGSLAFARAAIDGAKQWKFKPYIMNGRPVSVQTQLTISFKPVS